MKERYEGTNGRSNLIQTLSQQTICQQNPGLPEALASNCELVEFSDGHRIIKQGEQSSDIYLILTGSVKISVGSSVVDRVDSGKHVGEMAALEALPRSATVTADGLVVAGKISGDHFLKLCDQFPLIYKHISMELIRRLERRNKSIARANNKICILAISSAEAIRIGRTGHIQFEHESRICFKNWPDGIFNPSSYPLDDLEAQLDKVDFAIAIAQNDDITLSRNEKAYSPRDNVIFELGLFMGRLGRRRTILMKPNGIQIKLPSDLTGITTIDYPADIKDGEEQSSMNVAWEKVRQHVLKVGR